MFFSGDKDYCEATREIDQMLEQFSKDKIRLISLLEKNPEKLVSILWSAASPISKDDQCLFEMGKHLSLSVEDRIHQKTTISDSLINFIICPQCKNMRRIIDFTQVGPSQPFLIECGSKAGSYLVYNKFDIPYLALKLEKIPAAVQQAYQHPAIRDLAECTSMSCGVKSSKSGVKGGSSNTNTFLNKYAEMSYLASDPFTNNMLINWVLNDLNVQTCYMAWVCNKKGYNLCSYSDIGIISDFQDFPQYLTDKEKLSPTAKPDDKLPLKSEVVKGIVLQLFGSLRKFRRFDFSHGTPSTNTLKFSQEPASYIVEDVHITSPVTLKFTGFENSGCSVGTTRLYSKSSVAEEALKNKSFNPIIETNGEDVLVYRIKKNIKDSTMFMYMKHLGLPVFSSSFDIYAFMVVCMSESAFYTGLIHTNFRQLWDKMWSEKDLPIVSSRLKEFHEKNVELEVSDVLSILHNLDLRCDIIDYGWDIIRNMKK